MNIREFKKICKIDTEIITDITADDTVSKILNRPTKYPITSLQKKYQDYRNRIKNNPNSTRNKENYEYIKYLINHKNIIIEEIPQEIETEIINRNRQKKEGNKISGIYGYFDTKTGKYIYIGKDSNITLNLRDNQHYANDSQQINRILRNDKEGRYEYHIIETIENSTDLALDTAERYYIQLFNTYHYENPEGMNFTKGGEKSYGIETEAKIDYTKVTNKINNTYKGERDGIKGQKRVFGKNGDTFILTTNGSTIKNGEKIPKIRIENKETKGGMTSDGNLRQLLKRFKKDYGDSKLLIKPRIRNEYDEILTEFGY